MATRGDKMRNGGRAIANRSGGNGNRLCKTPAMSAEVSANLLSICESSSLKLEEMDRLQNGLQGDVWTRRIRIRGEWKRLRTQIKWGQCGFKFYVAINANNRKELLENDFQNNWM